MPKILTTSFFSSFFIKQKNIDTDFDVMIEAKNKDIALFKLIIVRKTPVIQLMEEGVFEF